MPTLLSPKDLALAIGVSESSLKRWADEGRIQVDRTLGGHRRIPLAEAVRFIRDARMHIVRPDILGLPDIQKSRLGNRTLESFTEASFEAMSVGDSGRLRALVVDMFLAGFNVTTIFDHAFTQSLRRIGEAWLHEKSGVFIEHRATNICFEALVLLRSIVPIAAFGSPVAIGAGPAEDPYIIPSLMASIVLQEAGYTTVNLGPDTPMEALIAGVEHYHPKLVWLSFSSVAGASYSANQMSDLIQRITGIQAFLAVGGRALRPEIVPLNDRVRVVDSMASLQAYGKSVIGSSPQAA